MFTITINTDNAAFDDANVEEEIARILDRVKGDLLGGMYGSNIRDFNGNTIGEWELVDR